MGMLNGAQHFIKCESCHGQVEGALPLPLFIVRFNGAAARATNNSRFSF